MKKFSKTSAAALCGAVVTALGVFFVMTPEQMGALQTVLTMLAVYFVPNAE